MTVVKDDNIEEFINVCNGFFGVYMHAIWGFNLLKKHSEKIIAENKDESVPNLAFIPYDRSSARVPSGLDADEFLSKFVTATKADEIVSRNQIDAINFNFMGQMILANIYQHWDEKYREKIAIELGHSNKNDLNIDSFGDIRLLRQAIMHNRGIATSDMARCKRFKWFEPKETINIRYEQILHIKNYIMSDLRTECEISIKNI